MNKNIAELAEQAGYPDCMTYGQDLVLERFAELIVRECIVRLKNNYPPDDCLPIEEIEGFLKDHFGVK